MDSVAEQTAGRRSHDGALVRALLVLTAAVFAQTLWFDFVFWDDDVYVFANPDLIHLTGAGVLRAFTSLTMSHWHPLTTLSHMADAALFGMRPGAHHAVNLLLHLANTLLLFGLLRSMTASPWCSAFVAAVFALHPLHVENVVWISDRKDLLSTFFSFLALHAYLRYVVSKRTAGYALLAVLFCLAVLSKSMGTVLPFVCLLLDFWPLQRVRWAAQDGADAGLLWHGRAVPRRTPRGLLVEKIPLFALMLAFGLLTIHMLHRSGLIDYAGKLPFPLCLANAVASYGWYLVKTVWPTRLAVEYIHPYLPGGTPWAAWHIIGAALLLLALSLVVWRWRRPYLVMGWLWFLGTLLPVSGVLQLGKHGRADRYMYIPMIGLLIMVAWAVKELVERYAPHARCVRGTIASVTVLALFLCAGAAARQARHWRDPMTFSRYQLSVVPDNPYLHVNMGYLLIREGKWEAALEHARKAVAVHPRCSEAHELLATIFAEQGDSASAGRHREVSQRLWDELRQAHSAGRGP
jgi:hypothetical protein